MSSFLRPRPDNKAGLINLSPGTDYLVAASNLFATGTNVTYASKKSITMYGFSGKVRISFEMNISNASYTAYGQIYKNGVPVGIERSTNSLTYVSFTEDFYFTHGDIFEVYGKTSNVSGQVRWQNFKIMTSSNYVPVVNVD